MKKCEKLVFDEVPQKHSCWCWLLAWCEKVTTICKSQYSKMGLLHKQAAQNVSNSNSGEFLTVFGL